MAHLTTLPKNFTYNSMFISPTQVALNMIQCFSEDSHAPPHCNQNATSKAQTAGHATSASTAQDQNSNDDESRAGVIDDNSTTATAQAPGSDAVPFLSGATQATATEPSTASGVQGPRISSACEQDDTRKSTPTGLMTQYPAPPMSEKSLQSIQQIPHPRYVTRFLTRFEHLLWTSSPLTLELVGENLYCPRLVINWETPLGRILQPAHYPLDFAILLILKYRNSGRSMPLEAETVLTMYEHLRQFNFSGLNITLIDPLLFNSSHHPPTHQKAFHKQLGGWISLLYQRAEISDLGMWRLEMIDVDYAQLQIFLSLSKGSSHYIYALPSGSTAPPRTEIPWEVSFSQVR